MDNNHGRHNSNGFLLGLLLGAGIALLISTKKGRNIIKEITENGIDALEDVVAPGELKDLLNEDLEEEISPIENDMPDVAQVKSTHAPTRSRRFFSGIKKKN